VGFCVELIYEETDNGNLPFTALAIGDDGTLYLAKPLMGEVVAMRDTDEDGIPDTPETILSNLDTPNTLTFHEGALYIGGGSAVYRWQEDTLTTLVDTLPNQTGIWGGGIVVYENRIVLGLGMDCAYCTPDTNTRGILTSFALDGSDPQVLATGFRQPTALSVVNGALFAGDTLTTQADGASYDEVNEVVAGGYYGEGECDSDCPIEHPVYKLPPTAAPIAIVPYEGEAFPDLANHVILLLGGALSATNPVGYQVLAVENFGQADAIFKVIVPGDETTLQIVGDATYNVETGYHNLRTDTFNWNGEGFYPQRPVGLAIDRNGWMYVSVSGGRLYLIRPS
jgi:glucose/arabinose dehydrogenase